MCGIIALVNADHTDVDEPVVRRMMDMLTHRGPDDEGCICEGPVGLGFRRLSIIDLSVGGHQPMTLPDGSLSIVFNGEIYNYLELREELRAKGHAFVSASDTE